MGQKTNWIYNEKEFLTIDDFKSVVESPYGFTYKITLLRGNEEIYHYYGRKNLFSKRKRKFGKRELSKIADKRLKKYEILEKESDWHSYCSSNKYIKENLSEYFLKREILHIVEAEEDLKIREATEIICNNAMLDPKCLNSGVSIRLFKKKFE